MTFIIIQTNFLSGLSPINGFFNIIDEKKERESVKGMGILSQRGSKILKCVCLALFFLFQHDLSVLGLKLNVN